MVQFSYQTQLQPDRLIMNIDMDKMVSIKGLVIRTTPVIPDMKTGMIDIWCC